MKTIKDLRDLIAANEENLNIGKLSIRTTTSDTDPKKDIDFYLEGSLLAWVPSGETEDKLLTEISMTISSDWDKEALNRVKTEHNDMEKTIEELKGKIVELVGQSKVDEKNAGKVEVYEKLLLTSNISLTRGIN